MDSSEDSKMALYVNTNISSLNATRHLASAAGSLDTAFKRLASGLRINSARDDAAGLQISDRLTAQINGLEQGNRNAQDGISLCQTAEGALDEMTNMYQRIRTLALQSANGTNSAADRQAIQREVEQLYEEINRIGNDTTFGGIHILDGSLTAPTDFQVGANARETVSADLTAGLRPHDIFETLYSNSTPAEQTRLLDGGFGARVECEWNGVSPAFNVTVDSNAPAGDYNVRVMSHLCSTAVYKYDSYFDKTVTDNQGNTVTIPADERTFGEGTITFSYGSGATAGSCTIQVDDDDTLWDIRNKCNTLHRSGTLPISWGESVTTTGMSLEHILSNLKGEANRPLSISTSGDESLKIFEFSVNSDSISTGSISINSDNRWSFAQVAYDTVVSVDGDVFSNDSGNSVDDPVRGLHITASRTYNRDVRVKVGPATPFPVSTLSEAQNTLAIVDRFIAAVDSKRAELGAVQNRLESAIRNQASVSENVAAARSRIRDADFATESAAMIRQNILQKAAQSILSQANQRPGIALALLQK